MPTRTVRSTRAAAPAKKAPAKRAAAPAPAKKTAAPAKKAVPAKRAVAPKAPVEAAEKKVPATKPKLQAHDVLRAHLDMVKAQQTFQELHRAYWEEYGEAVDFAVDHSKAVMELDAPKQQGPKRKDGPVRHAIVDQDEAVIGETFDRERLENQYSLPQLRALFKELLEKDERLTPTLKKLDILKQLEENGYFREEVDADSDEADDEEEEALGAEDESEEESDVEDEDEDDDSDDEEEDEEDEGFLTAEDLDEMSLGELRGVAEENGVPTKGKKEDALREELKALLPGVDEDDEDDEDEDEEDDDEGYLTVEDLADMDLEELLAVAKDTGDKPPAAVAKNAAKLRKWLEPYLDEDDDEEDED
jgi:hypothetical protein